MCIMAVCAALYFVLTQFFTIRIANIRISIASLPILVLAVLYGAKYAAISAIVGETAYQLLSYGLTATTVLWVLPSAARGVMVALGYALLTRSNLKPQTFRIWFLAVLILSAVRTTVLNTGITWLDSVIYHYYTKAYVFGDLGIRFVSGILTALVMWVVLPPITKALRKFA